MQARLVVVSCAVLLTCATAGWGADAATGKTALPAYRVETDGFAASEADVRAVLDSASRELWQFFPDYRLEPIVVTRGRNGPITLFQRNDRGEIVIQLDTEKTFWSQYSYQFAHEFCHVLCGCRPGYEGNRWFEETLCETASLYVMRAMSRSWKTSPPFPNWKDYRDSLRDYADDVVRRRDKTAEIYGHGLAGFYRAHQATLQKQPTSRELNGAMAVAFLHLFEERPERWGAVRWLNSSPAPQGEPFAAYLQRWHDAAPARHRAFVKRVADLYGAAIRSDAVAEPPAVADSAAGVRVRDVAFRCRVEAEGFQAGEQDIRAVLASAGRELWRHFPQYPIEPIVVMRGHAGPIVLHARNAQGEIVVCLDSEGTRWSQYAYQFSGRFAHILCGFDEKSTGNKWFEDSVCEAASLYALKQMAHTWEHQPPYPNWKDYRHALAQYVQQTIGSREPVKAEELRAFYAKHREALARGTDTRPMCQAIAAALLPVFEKQPEHWESIRWLNSRPSPPNEPLEQYLQRWHAAVPEKHRAFVRHLATLFGVANTR